jgi:hypothetical protein
MKWRTESVNRLRSCEGLAINGDRDLRSKIDPRIAVVANLWLAEAHDSVALYLGAGRG